MPLLQATYGAAGGAPPLPAAPAGAGTCPCGAAAPAGTCACPAAAAKAHLLFTHQMENMIPELQTTSPMRKSTIAMMVFMEKQAALLVYYYYSREASKSTWACWRRNMDTTLGSEATGSWDTCSF